MESWFPMLGVAPRSRGDFVDRDNFHRGLCVAGGLKKWVHKIHSAPVTVPIGVHTTSKTQAAIRAIETLCREHLWVPIDVERAVGSAEVRAGTAVDLVVIVYRREIVDGCEVLKRRKGVTLVEIKFQGAAIWRDEGAVLPASLTGRHVARVSPFHYAALQLQLTALLHCRSHPTESITGLAVIHLYHVDGDSRIQCDVSGVPEWVHTHARREFARRLAYRTQ
jgi:hypothetical protein